MVEVETNEELEFKWGKKKGRGGRNKDVQFYESFTYDGVEYGLYDCVYLYKEGEPEPEIGMLIKIWETGEKAKKVKVLWFFRPCEILNFLGVEEILENELFLASGEGVGLANLNPLEAIAGKCNVLCISKDKENHLPSDEELKIAEFVFRRTFDVGQQKIMDKIDGQIAGIDVKFMFNQLDIQKPGGVLKVDLGKNEVCGNAIESNETMVLSKKNSFNEHVTLETNGNCVDSSTQENADLVKHKPSPVEKPAFGVGLKSSDMDKTNEKWEHVSNPKALSRSKVKSDEGEVRRGKIHARQVEGEANVNCTKDSVDLDNRPTKKAQIDCTIKVSDDKGKSCEQRPVKVEEKIRCTKVYGDLDRGQSKKLKFNTSIKVVNDKSKSSDQKRMNDIKVLSSTTSTLGDKCKLKNMEDSLGTNKAPCKKTKPDDKVTTLSNVKLPKTSQRKDFLRTNEGPSEKTKPNVMTLSDCKLPPPTESQNKAKKSGCQALEVTRHPDADRRTWFKGFPWEDRMLTAHEQGTLVLLQNLDPAYTSAEVEDIVWHGFKESCMAKMIQRISNSSPHSGQALVIFKTREAAQMVVRKLDEGCLLLSNGRPLVSSIGTPCSAEKKPNFFGHLVIDKLPLQMLREREMKEAVSTSHCSQPNTIEYDMAMEWCLLQERSDLVWGNLYKQQGTELRKLKAELKAK